MMLVSRVIAPMSSDAMALSSSSPLSIGTLDPRVHSLSVAILINWFGEADKLGRMGDMDAETLTAVRTNGIDGPISGGLGRGVS